MVSAVVAAGLVSPGPVGHPRSPVALPPPPPPPPPRGTVEETSSQRGRRLHLRRATPARTVALPKRGRWGGARSCRRPPGPVGTRAGMFPPGRPAQRVPPAAPWPWHDRERGRPRDPPVPTRPRFPSAHKQVGAACARLEHSTHTQQPREAPDLGHEGAAPLTWAASAPSLT
jgi:hypothetical protein